MNTKSDQERKTSHMSWAILANNLLYMLIANNASANQDTLSLEAKF